MMLLEGDAVHIYDNLRRFLPVSIRMQLENVRRLQWFRDGARLATRQPARPAPSFLAAAPDNPLRDFFEANRTGPGIWKWTHYFDVYHRHLAKFRARAINIMEVGIYSGGSLNMWRHYFGPEVTIYGVDIEPACRAYEQAGVHILIGDQADAGFWANVRKNHPPMDIIIDDGGHLPNQQSTTMREMLPFMSPGGVYICEDIHGRMKPFSLFMFGLTDGLNASEGWSHTTADERRISAQASGIQTYVKGISFYPYMAVVELADSPVTEFVAPKHGTEWQPFLK
jgi:hypothetical protein